MRKFIYKIFFIIILLSFLIPNFSVAQSNVGKIEKWMAVGELQNWFSSIGCEREEDGPEKQQQAGWRWPAPYLNQDMQAAKGLWIGAKNYTEPIEGSTFDFKVVHCGPRPQTGGLVEFFPIEFKHYSKFKPSTIRVDGAESYFVKTVIEDENIKPDMPYDQMLYNVVNTQMGMTMKRKIFQFSGEYFNNFIVTENTFINTGNIDVDPEIERTSGALEDVYFYYQYRMAPCRETRLLFGDPTAWGRNTLNDERGPYRNDSDNPEQLRYQYSWHGYFQDFSSWNNVGGPIWKPTGTVIDKADSVGRLASSQFPGILVLHADKSISDRTDDPMQPTTTGYIASDGELNYASNPFIATEMQKRYNMMSKGHAAKSHAEVITDGDFAGSTKNPAEGSANNAGYSFVNGFGPYQIPYGDSIKIILVEAAAGLSREEAIRVGKLYKDGAISATEKNEYVLQGKDSLHQTFKRVVDLYNNNWELPEAPMPPKNLEVFSRGGRIELFWDIYDAGIAPQGFELYRSTTDHVDGYADNQFYSKYELVTELGPEARSFVDTALVTNTAYYYYLQSVGDNVPANTSLNIPSYKLRSSRFYAQTYAPAYKRSKGASTITNKVRIVPNPYIISATGGLLFPGEENKISFVNISGECTIAIYSELGELIKTIVHDDGSGSHDWLLTTSSNQFVVSGIYIAVITDKNTGDREIAKFSIIR
ncbi:MAG: hypothetical protein H6613_10215 [Ignavibacteriales bacterium]|nr:hypothetical protein [Ignavibacteriales bacterium]